MFPDSIFVSDSLYTDKILVSYHAPKNYGLKPDFDIEARGENPLCGDAILIRVTFDKEKNKIQEISFESRGCVIGKAAASLLFENVKGRTREEVSALSSGDIVDILGISISPIRLKCALLPLEVIQKAM